jgi:hypothetical protein
MRLLVLAMVVVLVACASAAPGTPRADRDVLTLEEIDGSDQPNAYDLVRTLRPQWLRSRGPSSINNENPIMVYVDGNRMGGPETLSLVPSLSIEEMRFLSPSEAQSRYGLNHTNGAIVILTRRG